MAKRSKSIIKDTITFFNGINILDLAAIERQGIKSRLSSLEEETKIKFSKKVLKLIKSLFSFIKTNIVKIRNSFPLMVI
jgi:hypothetical protein